MTLMAVFRAIATILVPAHLLLSLPPSPSAASQRTRSEALRPQERDDALLKVRPPRASVEFPVDPTDADIFRARVFEEPLVPIGGVGSAEENRALAAAISTYLNQGGSEETAPLEAFLATHPDSVWRASLLTDLGIVYRRTGYFSRAIANWERAWSLAKDAEDPHGRAIADRAVGELAELSARLGRVERLQELFSEVASRDVRGSAAEKIQGAKEGLWLMLNDPGSAFRCGPMAVEILLAKSRQGYAPDPLGADSPLAKSTRRGTSLDQLRALATSVGLKMQMAKRLGPEAAIVLPAVVHWRAGHFAALVAEASGSYRTEDPTFGDGLWITRRALEEESTGYFLVPDGPLPVGWRPVLAEEGQSVWGKGSTDRGDSENQDCQDQTAGGNSGGCKTGSCRGLATYTFHAMMIGLSVDDSPVGYSPPMGPPIQFSLRYHQREEFQPQIFTYSNLGPKWTSDWISYVEDNPSNPLQTPRIYLRGGGRETPSDYDPGTQASAPHYKSHATLVRTASSPIRYERRLRDGSVDVYAQPDGAAISPRKVFLTEVIDPLGNAVKLTYDDSMRMVTITDAIGQVTALSYDVLGDPYKITRVTDPFGRFATFEYNGVGQLSKITDVIGLTSEFRYSAADFIFNLTTPYGTTSFSWFSGPRDRDRWLEAVDPLGGRERIEYKNDVPSTIVPSQDPAAKVPVGFQNRNVNLGNRNTFYWDKRAMALYPGDYSKAHIFHWLHSKNYTLTSGVLESEKAPLENRIWYAYANQPVSYQVGSSARPTIVARVLDDGTTQAFRYEYNARGKVIRATDPLGRETIYVYGTHNTPDPNPTTGTGLDLLQVKQKNPSGASGCTVGTSTGCDLLASYTYNSQHQVLTSTDASGQTTMLTYLPDGRLQTIVAPPHSGLQPGESSPRALTGAERTTTFSYFPDSAPTGAARLHKRTGASIPQGAPTTNYTYDGFGRVRTVTDSDNYTLTYDYDALDRPRRTTYPDGTYEETVYHRLDTGARRDRLGRWTYSFYDALRRVISTRDPLGRTIAQQWCDCGSLDKLIDANGHATRWEYDLQGRITREVRTDEKAWEYTYENTTGRLKERKDPKLQVTGYEYLLDNNLQEITYSAAMVPTPNVSFTYDPNHNRIASVTDGMGPTSYGYHPIGVPPAPGAGRLASVDGPLANDTVSYAYDPLGRTASHGLPGFDSTLVYDALGRLARQESPVGNFTSAYHGAMARLLSLSYPNGQTTRYTYFPNSGDHRLQEIRHLGPGAALLSKNTYTYDVQSNIQTWTQQVGTSAAKLYDLNYDPADQLAAATLKSTDPTPVILKRYSYAFDLGGNRTSEQADDSATSWTLNPRNQLASQQGGGVLLFRGSVSEPATVNVQGRPVPVAPDNRFEGPAQVPSGISTVAVTATDPAGNLRTNTYQLSLGGTAVSYSYDFNGNLTSDGTRTFEWDAENRLTAVKQGATTLASFAYDAWGRRVQKTAGALTRTYVYDAEDVIEERLSSGQTVHYVHGLEIDQPLAQRDSAAIVAYYLADHLGSIVQMTNSAGTTTLTREYDPWGNLLQGSSTSGYAFTGREWDSETGLYFYRARYYDPGTTRFLSEDPIGLEGGVNLYTYVGNDPVSFNDPYGLDVDLTLRNRPEEDKTPEWLCGPRAPAPRKQICIGKNPKFCLDLPQEGDNPPDPRPIPPPGPASRCGPGSCMPPLPGFLESVHWNYPCGSLLSCLLPRPGM
jgi:RHS repeat-associated protein